MHHVTFGKSFVFSPLGAAVRPQRRDGNRLPSSCVLIEELVAVGTPAASDVVLNWGNGHAIQDIEPSRRYARQRHNKLYMGS